MGPEKRDAVPFLQRPEIGATLTNFGSERCSVEAVTPSGQLALHLGHRSAGSARANAAKTASRFWDRGVPFSMYEILGLVITHNHASLVPGPDSYTSPHHKTRKIITIQDAQRLSGIGCGTPVGPDSESSSEEPRSSPSARRRTSCRPVSHCGVAPAFCLLPGRGPVELSGTGGVVC